MANPFVTAEIADTQHALTDDLPQLKEFAWDFQNDRFRYDARGCHVIVTENEALKVWVYKALKTRRYRYECYRHGELNIDSAFGVDLDAYIGKNPNNRATAHKIMAEVRETLELNPYIRRIISIDIVEQKKDRLTISIELESIYGGLQQEVSI